MQDFARAHSLSAMKTLIEIHENAAVNPEARISAAKYVIDRAWGRPTQTVITDPPDPSKVIDMIEEAEESVGDIMDVSMQIADKVEDQENDEQNSD